MTKAVGEKPVTVARIERALDVLADFMVSHGAADRDGLPEVFGSQVATVAHAGFCRMIADRVLRRFMG